MDSIELHERFEAGREAMKVQEEHPELADLPLEVVTDLAKHNFRCVMSGEPVLGKGKGSYRIFRYTEDNPDPNNEVEYAAMFTCYWEEAEPPSLELVKTIK
jgi:hypothetical protein